MRLTGTLSASSQGSFSVRFMFSKNANVPACTQGSWELAGLVGAPLARQALCCPMYKTQGTVSEGEAGGSPSVEDMPEVGGTAGCTATRAPRASEEQKIKHTSGCDVCRQGATHADAGSHSPRNAGEGRRWPVRRGGGATSLGWLHHLPLLLPLKTLSPPSHKYSQ